MRTLRVRPEADRDIELAADYYAREANLDVALRFLGAIDEAYARLLQHPLSGTDVKTLSPRLSGLRFCVVPGFESYLVFDLPSPGHIEIVRVLHGAQDLMRILEEEPHDE